jgi:hypothetical protein
LDTDVVNRTSKKNKSSVGRRSSSGVSGRGPRHRIPSTSVYMATAAVMSALLFFTLWWMLHTSGDEAPWVPAGLAAIVVMLVAVAAREVIMRRAWTRYILEQDRRGSHVTDGRKKMHHQSGSNGHRSMNSLGAALREIQKRSAEAEAAGSLPNLHLETYHSCKEYLANSDNALRTRGVNSQNLAALRAGQDRVRALQKHHLLTWASGSSRALTFEAQRRVSLSDKIEMALRAIDVIDSALKVYPDASELHDSATAIREYISSVKVAHWIELAERAAFKGQYSRAIDRYRDALFYLSRESMSDTTRDQSAERISREISLLRARLKTRGDNRRRQRVSNSKGEGEIQID